MEPVSAVGTHGFLRAMGLYRARLSAEMLDDPRYAPNNVHWQDILEEDHEARLQAYDGPRLPVNHNSCRRHDL